MALIDLKPARMHYAVGLHLVKLLCICFSNRTAALVGLRDRWHEAYCLCCPQRRKAYRTGSGVGGSVVCIYLSLL